MTAELQQTTLELMLQNKPKVSVKEALKAIETAYRITASL